MEALHPPCRNLARDRSYRERSFWNEEDLQGVDPERSVSGLLPYCFLSGFTWWTFESPAVSHSSERGARGQLNAKVNSVSSSFCVTLNGSTAGSFYFLKY